MATSSILKNIVIDNKRDVEKLCAALEKSEQWLKDNPRKEEYLDDINDIFPWVPRGEYKRVNDCEQCLCRTCKYRGSCSYQMIDPCTEATNYLMLQCNDYAPVGE
jgi:hypothetical protein